MTAETTECKQVTTEAQLKATTAPKWLLCPETDNNVIYPHRENIEITPLINGKEAFGTLEEAIKNATDSIDIICWGFDPSLRLSGPKGELRYGELLEKKAKDGVQVRVLIWYSIMGDALPVKSLPDYKSDPVRHNAEISQKIMETAEKELNQSQQKYQNAVNHWREQDASDLRVPLWRRNDEEWKLEQLKRDMERKQAQFEELYNQEYTHSRGTPSLQYDDRLYNTNWYSQAKRGSVKGLSFTTRDVKNFLAVSDMTSDSEMPSDSSIQAALGHNNATHHQKMVLIDYAKPDQAIGFVMGHNMQKNYYDDESHAFDSAVRYPGFRPWQDISTRVRGSVLKDLNDNFSKAWDKEIPYDLWLNMSTKLGTSRDSITAQQFSDALQQVSGYHCPTAQICRTEYTQQDKSILRAYERALGNTTDFVYSENQYFRYTPLATHLKAVAVKRKAAQAPDDLYWFVITNNPNSAGETPNTYKMLSELGQGEKLPQLAREEGQERIELQKMIESRKQFISEQSAIPIMQRSNYSTYYLAQYRSEMPELERKFKALKAKHPFAEEKIEEKLNQEVQGVLDVDDPQQAFELQNTNGLKVHIATLTSCTQEAKNNLYTQIYVHSKLLLVDDDYFLLGSANINKRSMEQDTELAIATPTPALASHCRNRLWKMHTKLVERDSKSNFRHWDDLMTRNWRSMNRGQALMGTLTHFYDSEKSRIPIIGATD